MRSDKGPWNDPDIMKVIYYYLFRFDCSIFCPNTNKRLKSVVLMIQMVHNGEAKCPRKSLSGIEEKIVSEDENASSKVLKSFSFGVIMASSNCLPLFLMINCQISVYFSFATTT